MVISEYLRYILAGYGPYRAAFRHNRGRLLLTWVAWLLLLVLYVVVVGRSDRLTMAQIEATLTTATFLRVRLLIASLSAAAEVPYAV